MRLIVDENMPGTLTQALRDQEHDVLAVKESMRGESDVAILARAQAESRVVVTQDKDFGEIAFRLGLPAQCGVVLFRSADSCFPYFFSRRLWVSVSASRRASKVLNSRGTVLKSRARMAGWVPSTSGGLTPGLRKAGSARPTSGNNSTIPRAG